ncbi:MAG: nucleotide exchange factor GrpE [Eubacteriales bacterium]|nr:nucleotide exchange factor GrpE [Eubacteriales bacterium]
MNKKKMPDDTPNVDREQEFEPPEDAENQPVTEEGTEDKEVSIEEEELNVRYLRLAADFQNYRKRVEKEKGDIYAYANEKIVVELLDVIDNFERALQHSDPNEGFAEGMNMIFKQLKGVLEKNGVEEMCALGEQFDPNFHHAVLTENSAEFESGKVTLVLQKGYMLNKKVIRPAMVKVAE